MAKPKIGPSGLPGGTGNLGFFRQLPSKTSKFKRAEGGILIVRSNAAAAARDLGVRRLSVQPALLDDAKTRAAHIQQKMQAAALVEYSKTGTGRFARGIKAQVSASRKGNVDETIIKVSSMNYRETRFLTNIGGIGYFKRYPVQPYTIWAKGARDKANETPIGVNPRSASNLRRIRGMAGVGRLKVPREGNFFIAARKPGRGGGESRILNDWATLDPTVSTQTSFYYPLKVEHPGFRRDIIADIAREEGAKFIIEAKGIVSESLGGQGGRVDTNDMVVADEIPLTRVGVVLSGRGSINFRAIDYSGYQVDPTGRRIR